jgi:hypothetical protein
MVSRVALTPQGELTVLKLLAAGKDLEFVAAATTVQLGTVDALAREHGWPDRDKLSFAAVQLQASIDQAARNGLQRYSTSTPPRPHTPAPVQQVSKQTLAPAAEVSKPSVEEFTRVVELAAKSHRAGTRNKAKKLQQLLIDVRELVKEEAEHRLEEIQRARVEEEARREIAELEAQLAAAREKLRLGKPSTPGKAGKRLETPAQTAAKRRVGARQNELLARFGVTVADVRRWARDNGYEISDRAPWIAGKVLDAYEEAHRG